MPDSPEKAKKDLLQQELNYQRNITQELQKQARLQKEEFDRIKHQRDIAQEINKKGYEGKEYTKELKSQDSLHRKTSESLRDWFINYKFIGDELSKIQGISKSELQNQKSVNEKLKEEIKSKIKSLELSGQFFHLEKEIDAEKQKLVDLLEKENELQKKALINYLKILGTSLLTNIASKALYVSYQKIGSLFGELENSAAAFRMSLGITRINSKDIEDSARAIQEQFSNLGVSVIDVYSTAKAITNELGSTSAFSKGIAIDVSIMAQQFGVAHGVSIDFLRVMSSVSKTSMETNKALLSTAQSMSAAAGTNLSEVMSDVSVAARTGYEFLSKDPIQLLKAAIQARQLGTSLQSVTSTAKQLLSFTSSVSDEMEMSVLLGKSVNLQKARELAYHKDLVGLNQEILNIAKQTNFENLDPFQQDAVAKALGKSADEIGKMLTADRERVKSGKSLAQVQKEQMELSKMTSSNTAAWQSLMNSISRLFNTLIPVVNVFAKIIQGIANGISWVESKLGKWGNGIVASVIAAGMLFGVFMKLKGLISGIGLVGKGIGGAVGEALTGVSKGVGSFSGTNILKGALSMVIVASSMWILGKSLQLFQDINWKTLGIAAIALIGISAAAFGLSFIAPEITVGAIALGILGLAMLPFAAAAWITSKALQNLSSVAFGTIAKGFLELGASSIALGGLALALMASAPSLVLFSVALIPFTFMISRAAKATTNLEKGLSGIVESMTALQGMNFSATIMSIVSLTSAIVELSKVLKSIPDVKIGKLSELANVGTNAATQEQPQAKQKTDATNQDLLEAINSLTTYIKGGGAISNVFIDSQKLDALAGRRMAFTGTLT